MRTIRWTGIGLSLALLAASASCGDSTAPAPVAGDLTVSLVTPHADDGVVLLALFGPEFTDIQPASSAYRVYSLTASPTEVRVLVVGDLTAGPILTLRVNDPGRIGEYSGVVKQAASRSDEVRTVSTDYDLTFAAH
jgi:hypothetical protein